MARIVNLTTTEAVTIKVLLERQLTVCPNLKEHLPDYYDVLSSSLAKIEASLAPKG